MLADDIKEIRRRLLQLADKYFEIGFYDTQERLVEIADEIGELDSQADQE
jgi:hypothetical protein